MKKDIMIINTRKYATMPVKTFIEKMTKELSEDVEDKWNDYHLDTLFHIYLLEDFPESLTYLLYIDRKEVISDFLHWFVDKLVAGEIEHTYFTWCYKIM